MKALTAFRRVLQRRGKILSTKVHCLLCTDDIIEFRVKFHFQPNRKGKNYEAFVAARTASQKVSPELREET